MSKLRIVPNSIDCQKVACLFDKFYLVSGHYLPIFTTLPASLRLSRLFKFWGFWSSAFVMKMTVVPLKVIVFATFLGSTCWPLTHILHPSLHGLGSRGWSTQRPLESAKTRMIYSKMENWITNKDFDFSTVRTWQMHGQTTKMLHTGLWRCRTQRQLIRSENQTVEKPTSDFKDCLISNVNIFVF